MQAVHSLAIQHYNGGLALIGAAIDHAVTQLGTGCDTSSFHITLVTPSGYESIDQPPLSFITITPEPRRQVKWLSVVWRDAPLDSQRNIIT